MKVASQLHDARINAKNVLLDITIAEYEVLVKGVLQNNEFQRKRVRSSKTVYSLLRSDLLIGCVIPPVVLALNSDVTLTDFANDEELADTIRNNAASLVILDGLQRTHTIIDLLNDLRREGDETQIKKVEESKIRVEIYIGLNRLGILYRMLTLNTGQTPMSLRQQIEILYLDYIDTNVNGVELIREAEGRTASKINQFNFKDVVEGFNAYLDRDELPIDKANILENINSLEKLSKENKSTELFEKYLEALSLLVETVADLCEGAELSVDYLERNASPFGKNVTQIFKRPQAMSGLGAALGKLIDFEIIGSVDDAILSIKKLEVESGDEFLEEMNNSLEWLKNNTTKIGNAQRTFFSFYFRDLLNRDSDSYADLLRASKSALRKYQSQNL
ncbi:hypothetical protein [Arthrobacter globiformis]|uniref:hypothetical protein n=1 Tax=Arthrobacter globiformis TaxID=1665 RepID=UPI0027876305|nr:hypothetical protein [Arthrobacter globiformis]MDQ0863745.1 hypothetical protein [Arthrobacter globiformis]